MCLSSFPFIPYISSVGDEIYTSTSLFVESDNNSSVFNSFPSIISPVSLNTHVTSTSSGAFLSIFPTETLYSTVFSSAAPLTVRLNVTVSLALNSTIAFDLFLFHVTV